MNATYHLRVGRVVLTSEAADDAQAQRLRSAVIDLLESQFSSGPLPPPAIADVAHVDVPAFGLTSPEGERRAARSVADAIVRALRGER